MADSQNLKNQILITRWNLAFYPEHPYFRGGGSYPAARDVVGVL